MSRNIFINIDWLKVENNRGYGPLPIPVSRDAEISDLLREWSAFDEPSRKTSLLEFQNEYRFTLLAYGERMASLTVRDRNAEHLLLGLIAIGLDGWRDDWRENLVLLSLHYDAAKKISISPDKLFEKAATFLDDNAATGLRSFPHRSEEDKSLEAMGYKIGKDADGFRYRRTW